MFACLKLQLKITYMGTHASTAFGLLGLYRLAKVMLEESPGIGQSDTNCLQWNVSQQRQHWINHPSSQLTPKTVQVVQTSQTSQHTQLSGVRAYALGHRCGWPTRKPSLWDTPLSVWLGKKHSGDSSEAIPTSDYHVLNHDDENCKEVQTWWSIYIVFFFFGWGGISGNEQGGVLA